MTKDLSPSSAAETSSRFAEVLAARYLLENYQRTDRMFVGLMLVQFVAGIGVALWISPRTWEGTASAVHPHVWAAIILGGLCNLFPAALAWWRPGEVLTRHVVAVGQVLTSALLIHLMAGRVETHFHIFGSLAFLAFYRDWKVLISATVVVAADHFFRGIYFPQSVYGILAPEPWRWLEHAFWVVFEDVVLILGVQRGVKEVQAIAQREANLNELNQTLSAQVTETRQALEQLNSAREHLVQAEKLASLGGMVAGVAHEINTPLGIGVTAASHLHHQVTALSDAASSGPLTKLQFKQFLESCQQSADIILRNLRRAADLIQSFKRVSADQSSEERRRVNLKAHIEDVLLTLRPQLRPAGFRTELDCADGIEINTLPGALSQIVTNLVVNATVHAYEEGKAGTIRIQAASDGRVVTLQVADDGRGIPPENLSRIFDPFFTTRRGNGGTGLGLHIVFNLAHQTLGGRIRVNSTVGQGTTFILEFPASMPAGDQPGI